MLIISLVFVTTTVSLVATEGGSPLKLDTSPQMSLEYLIKQLFTEVKEEKGKTEVNGKIDSKGINESLSNSLTDFDLQNLQVSQPSSTLNLDKAILPEDFNPPGVKTIKKINLKEMLESTKKQIKDSSFVPLSIGVPELCNHAQYIDPTENNVFLIQSQNFPDYFPPGFTCRWLLKSPDNTKISLTCNVFDVPKCTGCGVPEGFFVSRSGDPQFKDAKVYSGTGFSKIVSANNSLAIFFSSQRKSKIKGGRFNCRVQLEDVKSTQALANCNCGWSNTQSRSRLRIVNGSPTGVNEYPFMAGLVQADDASIVCGAALISRNFVVSAAHCIATLRVSTTGVVLGEHDVRTGSDTSATILVRASQFIPYPYYDPDTQRYDIGLVRMASSVTFTQYIGPVCLPFRTAAWDLRGQTVIVMGWGTTDFGGQRSPVLLETSVTVIDMTYCNATYGSRVSWDTQLCTYGEETDSCQYDSGGPLIWRNPNTFRYELVATVEYGWGCAMGYPSINNKVSPFLQWIVDKTRGETYCY